MIVNWTRHAKQRYAERAARCGLNYGELEQAIKKQEFRIKELKDKIKTIFKIQNNFMTAVKTESKEQIYVLTLWESNEEEAELWKKR